MGILIEHFAGAFPLWLAPEQVRVLPISDKFAEYARHVLSELQRAGLRASIDLRPEKIGAKIRDAQLEKIPVMLVVGGKEAESQTVSYRDRIDGDRGAMPLPRPSRSSRPSPTRERSARSPRRPRIRPSMATASSMRIDGSGPSHLCWSGSSGPLATQFLELPPQELVLGLDLPVPRSRRRSSSACRRCSSACRRSTSACCRASSAVSRQRPVAGS